jgi:hypothetical protein
LLTVAGGDVGPILIAEGLARPLIEFGGTGSAKWVSEPKRKIARCLAQLARAHWSAPLTRSLTLKSRHRLVTLSGARDCLIEHFDNVVESAAVARAAIVLKSRAVY